MSRRYLEKVLTGEARGALSWLIRGVLWPFSVMYCAGLAVYLVFRTRTRLDVPVLSVGNLTFGGTGKTPVVQAICRILQARGLRVAVLSRGHGGSACGTLLVSDGENLLADASAAGDEPVFLASTLPGVAVAVGKDRRKSGSMVIGRLHPDVIVLDDGLQYWQLHRELDIAVLDATRPFGSGLVMPAGDLREPTRGLCRAGIILLNHSQTLTDGEYNTMLERLRFLAPNATVFRCHPRPISLTRVSDKESIPVEWLKGRRVTVFCGIGKPSAFIDNLTAQGAKVVDALVFADHHAYTPQDLDLVERRSYESGAQAIVTTEKDIARLGEINLTNELYTLGIEIEIERSKEFAETLIRGIGKTDPKAASAQANH
jgi:tetraacyldisaccharide 4'-kinase